MVFVSSFGKNSGLNRSPVKCPVSGLVFGPVFGLVCGQSAEPVGGRLLSCDGDLGDARRITACRAGFGSHVRG
jgi:hypothetical protein